MLEAAFPGIWESWLGRWFLWFVYTFLGLEAGVLLASAASWAVAKVVGVPETQPAMLALHAAVFGAVLGAGQWFALRRWVKGAGWWILATAGPFAVFEVVTTSGTLRWPASWPVLVDLGVFGAFLGLSQWLVLRQWVKRAGWWVLVSAVAWALYGTPDVVRFPTGTFLVGAITGVAMMLLLAQESPPEE